MRTTAKPIKNIDDYIAGFPQDVQAILKELRREIRKAAPAAGEAIKYRMPTFILQGNLVHFAAWKNHIGFYATPSAARFKKELARYKTSKGAIQFPLDKPLPLPLIRKIVKYRVKENLERKKK